MDNLPAELADLLPQGPKRPLAVVLASPQGAVVEANDLRTITVCFNQPMVPLRPVGSDDAVPPIQIEPKLDGHFRWKGTATLQFESKQPLPFGTTYKVTVPKGAKSWSGQELAQEYSFQFTTATAELQTSLPVHKNESVRHDQPFFLHFNQPMDASSSAGFIKLESAGKEIPLEIRAQKLDDIKTQMELSSTESYPVNGGTSFNSSLLTPKNGPVDPKILVVVPKQPLPAGSVCNLTIKSGLKGAVGQVGTPKDHLVSFKTYGPLALSDSGKVLDQNPEDGLYLRFNNPVSGAQLAKSIKISPTVEIGESLARSEDPSESWYIASGLKPNTEYTVTVAADLTDRYGQKLGKDTQVIYKTGNYRPAFECPQGLGLLESTGSKKLSLGIMNVESLAATVYTLDRQKLIELMENPNREDSSKVVKPSSEARTVQLVKSGSQNKLEDRELDLSGQKSSFAFVDFNVSPSHLNRRLVTQISNIGITAKYSAENCLFWTTRLSDGKPLAQAEVEIRNGVGKVLWTGKSDEQGCVQSPGWVSLGLSKKDSYDEMPLMYVFAKSGQDEGFIRSLGGQVVYPYDFQIPFSYSQPSHDLKGSVFTERGLYRPGEEVHFKGSLRERMAGQWKISELKELAYEMQDSRGNSVTKGVVKVNPYGGFSHSLNIADDAVTGTYSLSYRIPDAVAKEMKIERELTSVGFRVESFQAAQFEVTVKPEKDFYFMGDTARGNFKGWWLFGAPMNQAKLRWNAYLEPASLSPTDPAYLGYDFVPQNIYSREERSVDEGYKLAEGQVELDEQGLKELSLPLKDIAFKGNGEVIWEGTVTAAGGQELSGRAVLPLYKGDYQVGLKADSYITKVGEKFPLKVVAVNPAQKTVAGKTVKLEVLRREFKTVRKAGPDGAWEWISEPKDEVLGSQSVTTTDKPLDVSLSASKAGYIIVRATSVDGRKNEMVAESSFYCEGNDAVGWARSEGDAIKLVADKTTYKPNDTAKVMIQSPFETAQALITVEGQNVMERYVKEVKGNSPTIEIPIRPQHLPNVFVGVVLVQGRVPDKGFGPDGSDLGKPTFRMGYCNLPVDSSEKKLQVSLKTDKTTYGPGEEVQVEALVVNSANRGTEAEFSLAASDEGILKLIDFKTPNFFSDFYGVRPLSVMTGETLLDIIGMRHYGSKGANAGGGGGLDGELRKDFKPTAYWNGSITTDAQGKAKLHFKLPDNLTRFRLMAVAQTRASEFGSGEAGIEVRKDLLLRPASPEVVRTGDRFKCGVVVNNNSKSSQTVEVEAQVTGAQLVGNNKRSVTVAAGKEELVAFDFEAKEATTGKFSFSAKAAGLQDGVQLPLTVLQPVVTETVVTAGSVENQAQVELAVPQPIAPGTGSLKIRLAPSLMQSLASLVEATLGQKFEYSLSYVRALEILSMDSTFLERLGYTKDWKAKHIQETVRELTRYQNSDGGFTYCKSGASSDYTTIEALEALSHAKKAGLSISDSSVKGASEWLKTNVLNRPKDSPYTADYQLHTKVRATYVLSLAGGVDAAQINALASDSKQMSLETRIMLCRAAQRVRGAESAAASLRQSVLASVKKQASTAYLESGKDLPYYYRASLGLTSQALICLLEGGQQLELAPALAAWIVEDRSKRKESWSCDDREVIQALMMYSDRFEKTEPNFKGKVFIGSSEIMNNNFKSRKDEPVVKTVPVGPKDTKLPVKFSRSGQGRMYYSLDLTYASSAPQPARDEGIAVFKSFSDLKSGRRLKEFKAGEKYLATISMVTPEERHFVTLTDPIPAGFQVVQTNFATEGQDMSRTLALASKGDLNGWLFGPMERYSDRVTYFAESLRPGEYTLRYLVRATFPGAYVTPATKAMELNHPEVFGTTEAGTWTIK